MNREDELKKIAIKMKKLDQQLMKLTKKELDCLRDPIAHPYKESWEKEFRKMELQMDKLVGKLVRLEGWRAEWERRKNFR